VQLSMRLVTRLLLSAWAVSAAEARDSTQSGRPPAPSTAAPDVVRTPVRLDKKHPLIIPSDYYPTGSALKGEQGFCLVRVQVDPDGLIRAVQLVYPTSFVRLNVACLTSFMEKRLIPATADGKLVANWIDLPILWGNRVKPNQKPDYSATPHLDRDYRLKVGPDYYPATSREMHQEGNCLIHVSVSTEGTPSGVSVSKSTGFAPLDQACSAAIQSAQFMPGIRDGKPIVASTDIFINWQLLSR
jgi:TonB family protein